MEIEVVDEIGSTMDAARNNVQAGRVTWQDGRPVPCGFLALTQTEGRGQRGRSWYSRPGESLSVTYYLRGAPYAPDHLGIVALMAGVAAAGSLQLAIAGSGTKAPRPVVGLKWPNDLLLNRKKVGGVLIETTSAPSGELVALVGVGINLEIAEFPPELASLATSFVRESVPAPHPVELAHRIAQNLALQDFVFQHGAGLPAILEQWRAYNATSGAVYETKWNGQVLRGVAVGIGDAGELLLRLDDGREIAVVSASTIRERL